MSFSFGNDLNRLIQNLENIRKIEVLRANAAALNKAAIKVKGLVAKEIATKTKIPQKIIRKRIVIKWATAKEQVAKVIFYLRPVPAIHLLTAARAASNIGRGTSKRGVTAKGYSFPHAFIQRGKGQVHVFNRTGIKKKIPGPRGGQNKETIDTIKIDIASTGDTALFKSAKAVMRSDYIKLLMHELRQRTAKYGG